MTQTLQQTSIKPFFLFGGEENGDMLGGMNDFVAQYDSLASAQKYAAEHDYGWADVGLLHDGKITRVATIDVDTGSWTILEPELLANVCSGGQPAETNLDPHFGRIYLAWNKTGFRTKCAVCGEEVEPHFGYEFFHFLSDGVVCDGCAQKYAPIMYALRGLLWAVSYGENASQGREIFTAIGALVEAVKVENQWINEKNGNGL